MHISCILLGAGHDIDCSTSHGTDMATSACISPEGNPAYWRSEADRDAAFDESQPTSKREEERMSEKLKGKSSGLILNRSNN